MIRQLIKYLLTIFLASGLIIGAAYAGTFPTVIDNFVNTGTIIRAVDIDNIEYAIGPTGTTSPATIIYQLTNTNANNVNFTGKLTITSATTTNHTITNLWNTNFTLGVGTSTALGVTGGSQLGALTVTGMSTLAAATSTSLQVTGGAHIASLSLTNAVPNLTFTNGTTTNPLFLARGTFGLTQNGEIFINSNLGGTLQFREGFETQVLTATSSFSFSVASTTASENITLKRFDQAVTIKKVSCVQQGGSSPSVTFNLPHNASRAGATNLFGSDQSETNTTTGTNYYTFSDATLAAGEVIYLTTSAQTGATGWFGCTIYYKLDS